MTASEPVSSARHSEAFDVLVSAVETLCKAGRPPTASEVRLEMRSLTYGGFSLKELGYVKFRDFLYDAEKRGKIRIDSSRVGDYAVMPVGLAYEGSAESAAIRTDLWKAFVDWNANLSRWYDLKNDKAFILPREPAKLEPKSFQRFRADLASDPDSYIPIEPVSVKTQLEWMGNFAAERRDPVLRELLKGALASDKPIKTFITALKSVPVQYESWRREFAAKVRVVVDEWKASHHSLASIQVERDVSVQDLVAVPVAGTGESPNPSTQSTASGISKAYIQLASTWLRPENIISSIKFHSRQEGTVNESALRLRLHAAIDRMPLEELKALRIPVGYLFEE